MIRRTVKELTAMLMAPLTSVIGLRISSTVRAWRLGQMAPATMAATRMARKTEWAL